MSHGKDLGYSVMRIFVTLFVLTAIEVAWGMFFREPRWFLWSGLIVCMLIKGMLIFMYFMHMRFERFIVWALMLPTPLLVMIVLAANLPDTVFNSRRDHPVGYLLDKNGQVVNALDPHHPAAGRGTPHSSAGHEETEGSGTDGAEGAAEGGH